MNASIITENTESLLLYLYSSHLRSARSLQALRDLCPGEIDGALRQLIDAGYVYEDEISYELTTSGVQKVHTIHASVQTPGRFEAPHGKMLRQPRNSVPDVPKLDTHPLRTHIPPHQGPVHLHYLLAFETPQTALPIPVLDGDIAGRMSDCHISFPCDEFISGHHCRFTVASEENRQILGIEDLGSRNGTAINGFRIEPGVVIEVEHGSRIQIGSVVLIVVKIPR